MKILIVDDSQQMRRVIKRLLRRAGSETRECADGAYALASYAEWLPDWVLMDLKMERLDGLTATREIVDAFPEAKVLIVTSYDAPELREAARLAGARGYVVKDELLKLRELLSKQP